MLSAPDGNGPEGRHYTRPIDVLLVCTANMCRSPMLEAFLGSARRARGADAHVHSAGTTADGRGAVREIIDVSAEPLATTAAPAVDPTSPLRPSQET